MNTSVEVKTSLPNPDLPSVIEWVERLKREIPEEYWENTVVDFQSAADYGDCTYVTVEVRYVRPETPEEETERMKREKRGRQRQLEYATRQLEDAKKRLAELT